jgi:hypothetical protein
VVLFTRDKVLGLKGMADGVESTTAAAFAKAFPPDQIAAAMAMSAAAVQQPAAGGASEPAASDLKVESTGLAQNSQVDPGV